jgi:murein DD-endopeptidase MepM/ murein hydrolase activator NlpD
VQRLDDGRFETTRQNRPLSEKYFIADTLISSSVYEAARSSGVAPNLVVELIRLFSFSVDFQRDIRQGDQLEVLYTRRFDQNNQLAEEGEIVFAALTNRGERHAYWLHRNADGDSHYYDENGKSVQRLLMRTPVDGARLSSRFGMRRHPILGYTRLHRGLDFAAPTGTPIFAAGDGRVIHKSSKGNNGLFIKLQHKNNYQTAYAHMSRFAKGLKKGQRVKQGQIIGYVGRSGLATGPHLHYEVLQNNKPVNPRALDLPAARKMGEAELAALAETRRQAIKRIGNLAASQNALSSLPRRSGVPAR